MPAPDRPDGRKSKFGFGKCKLCGKEFEKKKEWQEFCISKHRDKWHNIKRILKKSGAL